jgi:hypothetical protein
MPIDTAIFRVKDYDLYLKCLDQHGLKQTQHALIARLGEKNLTLYKNTRPECEFPFSYSELPLSCQQDSLGTPWGLHVVVEKHGDGAPDGMIFKARQPTGECWHTRPDAGPEQACMVTTRILRLRGLEPGLNSGPGIDSFERYIYIHGTNHPEKFPENISAGCLLMLDEALIELYGRVPVGTHVLILQ